MTRRLLLFGYALAVLLPLGWIVLNSLRPSSEVFAHPLAWPASWTLANYAAAWTGSHFGSYALNSLWITAASTLLTVLLGAALAFATARYRLPGGRWVEFCLTAGLTVPLQLCVLPLFFWLKALGLLGSGSGLILVYAASGIPYSALLLRSFFGRIPPELYESAEMDGCTPRQAFWKITLPLATPALASVALWTAIAVYNEYFLALILLGGHPGAPRTLPLGLAEMSIASQYHADFAQLFAGVTLTMIPSLLAYAVAGRYLLKGLAEGALKG